MSKSLEEVYRKIREQQEAQRRSEILRESQRQEQLRKQSLWMREQNRLFESSFSNTSNSSAGAGGGKRRNDVLDFKNAESTLFIYRKDNNTYFSVYDFTNDILTEETSLGDYTYIYNVFTLQEKAFCVVLGIQETETNISYLINSSGQIVSTFEGGGVEVLDDKYLIIYSDNKVKLYGLSSELINIETTNDSYIEFSNDVDDYSKNGIYFYTSNEDSSYSIYYWNNNGSLSKVMDISNTYNWSIFQHRFCDISFIFTYDNNTTECILSSFRGEELISQQILSDISGYSYGIFITEDSKFILYGSTTNNERYLVYFNGSEFNIEIYTQTTWTINYNNSYFNGYPSDYTFNSFSLYKLDDPSYYNNFLGGTNIVVFTYFKNSEGEYNYEYPFISNDYIVNENNISYIGYDQDTSTFFRMKYSSGLSEDKDNIITDLVSLNQFRIFTLIDRFVILYESDVDESTFIVVSNDTINLTGLTMSSSYSYNIEGDIMFFYDDEKSFYINETDVIQMDYYVNEYENGSNFLTSDYISKNTLILYNEDSFPLGYEVLTKEGISQKFDPYSDNFDFSKGYVKLSIDKVISIQNISNLGSFYFSDEGENNYSINDGGNDMYDGGNEIYTNVSEGNAIEYTHTQLNDEDDYGMGKDPSNYPMDGVISNSYSLGASSSYFTNLYPGLFVFVADDVTDINRFYIDGELGADGDGVADIYNFYIDSNGDETNWGLSPSTTEYIVFVKQVYDAGDPSINQIFIFNNPDAIENYSHEIGETTDSDYNSVTFNGSVPTKISYLLLSQTNESNISRDNIGLIVKKYIELTHNKSISEVLTSLNVNYSDIVDILNTNYELKTSINIYNFDGALLDSQYLPGVIDEAYICKNRIIFNIIDELDNNQIWIYNNGFKKLFDDINLINNSIYINDYVYND